MGIPAIKFERGAGLENSFLFSTGSRQSTSYLRPE
jgi:hypothetical protein